MLPTELLRRLSKRQKATMKLYPAPFCRSAGNAIEAVHHRGGKTGREGHQQRALEGYQGVSHQFQFVYAKQEQADNQKRYAVGADHPQQKIPVRRRLSFTIPHLSRLIWRPPAVRMDRMSRSPHSTPTEPERRIRSIDAIRGFALFGVMLVNMYNFGAWSPEWAGTLDRIFSTLMHSVFETKSLRLFSILFGFGFALQLAKITSDPDGSLWIYIRRLVILFFFGMAHALIFDGDILMQYAMLGLILVAFQNFPGKLLLTLSMVLLMAFPIGNLVHEPDYEDVLNEAEDGLPLSVQREDHPYLGTLMDVFEENVEAIPPRIWEDLHQPESSLAIFSMFLLGFWLGRTRIIQTESQHLLLIRRVFGWGAGIGTVAALVEWWLQHYFGYAVYSGNVASPGIRFCGDLLFAYGSTALALAYGAAIVMLSRKAGWQIVFRPFQNMGKMALTVYLSGSLLSTTLFYGWGFGQLNLLGPMATTLYALLFFVILAVFSSWWLSRFRFGPVEWLWRSLTYLEVQPFRLK